MGEKQCFHKCGSLTKRVSTGIWCVISEECMPPAIAVVFHCPEKSQSKRRDWIALHTIASQQSVKLRRSGFIPQKVEHACHRFISAQLPTKQQDDWSESKKSPAFMLSSHFWARVHVCIDVQFLLPA